MTYTSTTTLADFWTGLDISQKRSIQDQLNQILAESKDFLFPSLRAPIFTEFIDRLCQSCVPPQQLEVQCVLTHGDLRSDNITVEPSDDRQFRIAGLLAWEYSGFYPEYHELIKRTNGLSLAADDDWYMFLPECISLEHYGMWWLLDYAEGAFME
ncbi:hypothetical protein ACJ73_07911 [Blastomyces percursus]|uniref:Aminoglycoside phosphotransferase domain-containing protein n=1 Tax=Blastomyces percursus TaxID=1658174 RepID=A0A1J9PXW5_9EURO|nr:hypothetical protein ACJ73_07911 [Blastomyces percursus]